MTMECTAGQEARRKAGMVVAQAPVVTTTLPARTLPLGVRTSTGLPLRRPVMGVPS